MSTEQERLGLIDLYRIRGDKYQQALWDVWVALGHDTDGDTGPGALISGMGEDGFIEMVLRDATQWRKESEDDYDADVSRLEAEIHALKAEVKQQEEWYADLQRRTGLLDQAHADMQTKISAGHHLGCDYPTCRLECAGAQHPCDVCGGYGCGED